ncbi:MAG: hypothetical protein J6L81_08960 [Clostridia bacterium]|nr:hypothetical protein [Clostridia bacterium]
MAYATHEFYTLYYKGKASYEVFDRFCDKAHAQLLRLTFGRAGQIERYDEALKTNIKLAECAILDELIAQEAMPRSGVTSQTTGRVSVSYDAGIIGNAAKDKGCYEAAAVYLSGTELMYRGVVM